MDPAPHFQLFPSIDSTGRTCSPLLVPGDLRGREQKFLNEPSLAEASRAKGKEKDIFREKERERAPTWRTFFNITLMCETKQIRVFRELRSPIYRCRSVDVSL